MPKRLLKDMVVVKHPQKIKEIKKQPKQGDVSEIKDIVKTRDRETNVVRTKPRHMLWSLALVSVIFFLFAISFLFSHAEVVVNPKTKDIIVMEDLSATKDSNNDSLSFDLVVIGGEEKKTIPATGEKDVNIQATGKVVIYNTFDTSSQKLNIDTRLEGSNGKIYKIQTKTVVPAMGKDGTVGSVEVGIYGAEAGEEYNSVPLDFKIFGFKGTPKYSKFYARSKGEITGGFQGKTPAISDLDKASAVTDLNDNLRTKLVQKVTGQIPSGFILFKNAIFLNTNDLNVTSTFNEKDNTATLTQRGTLYGLLFNEQKLTKKIVKDTLDISDNVFIPNIRDLVFSLSNKDNIAFDSMKSINFNLSGPAKVVWRLDVNKFTDDLLGKSKKDFNQTLLQYPNIDSAKLTLNFAWKTSLPEKPKDIKIIVNYPQ